MNDLVIKGGLIVDGTGRPGYPGDVVVQDGRIVGLGSLGEVSAARTVDAQGKVVSPGFMDPHTHADGTLLIHKYATSSVTQGITTEVISNCGSSMAPKTGLGEARMKKRLERRLGPEEAKKADLNWSTMGQFLDKMSYQRKSDRNCLILMKRLTPDPEPEKE